MKEFDTYFERIFDNLDSLADAISESLQSQVTIEDEFHNVIGYSSHHFESDPARISTIISRRVPNNVIAGLRKNGILQQLEISSHPIRIPAIVEVGLGPRIAVCIKNQNGILGYIWIVDTGGLIEGHAERIIEKAAEIARRFLLKQRSWKTRQDKTHDEFIWKLLTDHYQSELMIKQDAESLSLLLPNSFHVFVFEFNTIIGDEALLKFRQTVSAFSQVRLISLTAGQNQLIGLFSNFKPDKNKSVFSSFMNSFLQRIKESKEFVITAVGCSNKYNNYMQVANAYREVNSLIAIKKLLPFQTRHILHYDDLGFFLQFPSMMEYKNKLNYKSPLLNLLREHDRDSKSDFIKTLSIYLSFNCNLKESAAFLHIHANTLTYRLNRISEITGYTLKNTNYLVTIYLELLTEEMAFINDWLAHYFNTEQPR